MAHTETDTETRLRHVAQELTRALSCDESTATLLAVHESTPEGALLQFTVETMTGEEAVVLSAEPAQIRIAYLNGEARSTGDDLLVSVAGCSVEVVARFVVDRIGYGHYDNMMAAYHPQQKFQR